MMSRGNEGKSSSSSPSPNCDVGLGLRMQVQPTDSYSCDGGGGASFLGYPSNIHEGVALPRTELRASGGGGMPASGGKPIFTASQWEELERQKMIHKYIMASTPVPPEQLLPNSSTGHPPSLAPLSHSNSLDLRYSSGGSDAEPWRCKRTDGKKWRCSRDVAPDQKYCERHAHKTRPRSRKHVEPTPHSSLVSHTNHLTTQQQQPPGNNNSNITGLPQQRQQQQPLRSQLPRVESAASYDQARCIEWFIRGVGNSSAELKAADHDKYVARPEGSRGFDPWRSEADHGHQMVDGQPCNSKMGFLQTKSFIDGWDKKGLSGITNNSKFSPNSLTLSMSGVHGTDYHQDNQDSYIGMMMMNPGGPLGEALCLGNASVTRGGMNLASPHHSSSKSSCEDDSPALNFIG